MTDSAPPPPPPENPYGQTPYGQTPPPAPGYGQSGAPGPYGAPGAPGGGQPGNLLPRFGARILDFLIVGIVGGIISAIVGVAIGGYAATLLNAIIVTAIYLGYFVLLESSRGQTVGKMAVNLRVVGADGTSNPTTTESLKRNIWVGLSILGILGSIGTYIGGVIQLVVVIMIAVTINGDPQQRQSWFDKFSGTRVVTKG